jgi:hypothetical protein
LASVTVTPYVPDQVIVAWWSAIGPVMMGARAALAVTVMLPSSIPAQLSSVVITAAMVIAAGSPTVTAVGAYRSQGFGPPARCKCLQGDLVAVLVDCAAGSSHR